jgi:hypothetical protein
MPNVINLMIAIATTGVIGAFMVVATNWSS